MQMILIILINEFLSKNCIPFIKVTKHCYAMNHCYIMYVHKI